MCTEWFLCFTSDQMCYLSWTFYISLIMTNISAGIGESCTNPSRTCSHAYTVCDPNLGACVCTTGYTQSGQSCISNRGRCLWCFFFSYNFFRVISDTSGYICVLAFYTTFIQKTVLIIVFEMFKIIKYTLS